MTLFMGEILCEAGEDEAAVSGWDCRSRDNLIEPVTMLKWVTRLVNLHSLATMKLCQTSCLQLKLKVLV